MYVVASDASNPDDCLACIKSLAVAKADVVVVWPSGMKAGRDRAKAMAARAGAAWLDAKCEGSTGSAGSAASTEGAGGGQGNRGYLRIPKDAHGRWGWFISPGERLLREGTPGFGVGSTETESDGAFLTVEMELPDQNRRMVKSVRATRMTRDRSIYQRPPFLVDVSGDCVMTDCIVVASASTTQARDVLEAAATADARASFNMALELITCGYTDEGLQQLAWLSEHGGGSGDRRIVRAWAIAEHMRLAMSSGAFSAGATPARLSAEAAEQVLSRVTDSINEYPEYTDLRYIEGLCHLVLGKTDKARKCMEACIALGECWYRHTSIRGVGSYLAAQAHGDACCADGDWNTAVANYASALSSRQSAGLSVSLQLLERVVPLFAIPSVIEKYGAPDDYLVPAVCDAYGRPDDIALNLLELARALAAGKLYAAAVKTYERVLEADGSAVLSGNDFNGDKPRSRRNRRSSRLSFDDAKMYATGLMMTGRADDAVSVLQRVGSDGREEAGKWVSAVEALRAWKKAAWVPPKGRWRAVLGGHKDNLSEYLELLEVALSLCDAPTIQRILGLLDAMTDSSRYNEAGRLLMRYSQPDLAVEMFIRSISHGLEDVGALLALSRVLAEKESFDEALGLTSSAAELGAGVEEVEAAKAFVRLSQARSVLKMGLRQHPGSQQLKDRLARVEGLLRWQPREMA